MSVSNSLTIRPLKLTEIAMRYFRCVVVFLKTLFYITVFSQAGVLVVVMVESLLPFLDVVFNHLFHFVLEPYFSLIWRKLFNWICVYITLTALVVIVIKKQVDTHGETRPRPERAFKPTRFYYLFDSKLSFHQVNKLCHGVIQLDVLTPTETSHLMSYHSTWTKQEKLMELLEMLNHKRNRKEILMTVCHSLAINEEIQYSWFDYLQEKISRNDCSIEDNIDCIEELSQNSTSQETVATEVKFEKLYEKTLIKTKADEPIDIFNSFFRLSEGLVTVSTVAANQVELPFESELVSALWLITVSGGAKVTLGISHCVKLSVKNMSRIAMVTTTQLQKPLRLLYNEEASFSCRNQHGTITLPVLHEETATYLISIVTFPDPEPRPTGILYFRHNTLTCQYRYLIAYELCQQSRSFDYNHWRVHVVSFKNICGFAEKLVASKYSKEGITVDLCSRGYMDVSKGSLSVASVKQKGRKWHIFQANAAIETLFNIGYHRFTFDIDWTGASSMPDDFHCTVKWKGTKEVTKIHMAPKELNRSLVLALGLMCPVEEKPPRASLLPRMKKVTKLLSLPLAYMHLVGQVK